MRVHDKRRMQVLGDQLIAEAHTRIHAVCALRVALSCPVRVVLMARQVTARYLHRQEMKHE